MKALSIALLSTLMIGATAQAQNCLSTDGLIIQDGASLKMYYVGQPRKKIGPNYTCNYVSRVRTCQNGQLSVKEVQCSQYDSGGCVDSWIDMLPDSSFSHVQCED